MLSHSCRVSPRCAAAVNSPWSRVLASRIPVAPVHSGGGASALMRESARIEAPRTAHRTAPRQLTPLQVVRLSEPFRPMHGGELVDVSIRVECHGDPSLPPARTIVVMPSFSHSCHIASHGDDPSPGWWQDLVGPGRALDTRHFRILCPSVLGSPHSPTNPSSALDRSTGKPLRAAFPSLTPTDLARCHRAALSQLGIDPCARLHAVVGASLGGMQALQFASLYPNSVSRLVAIACTGRTTPFTVAVRRSQRRAILADPAWHGGNYEDFKTVPAAGLRMARELGTTFYRSRAEFDSRFEWSPAGDKHWTCCDTWEVESYLRYQGDKFVRAFDANAYLVLSKAMDFMDLGDGHEGRSTYAEGAGRIASEGCRSLLIGIKQDALIPPAELATLADTINRRATGSTAAPSAMAAAADAAAQCSAAAVEACTPGGVTGLAVHPLPPGTDHLVLLGDGTSTTSVAAAAALLPSPLSGPPAAFLPLDSIFGHDAFLKPRDLPLLGMALRRWLEEGLEGELAAEAALTTGLHAP